ncbi:UDP-glucose pyrophosphorylase [Pyrobaculum islandicum DSM 4184]|uniref:UTP--glucose-1-phosphate uridylyltransferase n=1 Tax=Pyrobaculum islandicum (strain DSM 4184 / JCM 9189 / GEO3) TaxID=384616 RepID=A1RUM7_PYRIL|nr:sugar phosphate nucleotidyltransferase [Pyrobaculum islandicum]ABL88659.1 UDP-glucose pyrophosphorylase [Pyrobaculum islandicum DSM 4184]
MQAVVAAAGLGTRLLPASKEVPKEMFPVFVWEGGSLLVKPVLQVVFEQLFDAGVREFCFVVGRGKRAVEDYFTPDWGLVEYLERAGKAEAAGALARFYERVEASAIFYVNQPKPLGFGHAVLTAEPFIHGDFVVAAGDTFLMDGAPLAALVSSPPMAIMVKEVEDPRQYGVAVVEGGRVVRVVEKPRDPPSRLAILPFYKLPSDFFRYLRRVRPGVGGEIQLTDAIQLAIEEGVEARPVFYGGEYVDVGTPQTYLKALELALHVARKNSRVD